MHGLMIMLCLIQLPSYVFVNIYTNGHPHVKLLALRNFQCGKIVSQQQGGYLYKVYTQMFELCYFKKKLDACKGCTSYFVPCKWQQTPQSAHVSQGIE